MSDNAILKAIGNAAGTRNKTFAEAVVCSVSSVDMSSRSCVCSPLGGKTTSDLTEVQLMAEVDDGWLLVPVIGSTVIVNVAQRSRPYVAMYSEIENAFLIVTGNIQLQGGELGGLIKIEDLVTKLNTLEDDLNTIKAAFTSWVPIPNDGGAALKAAAAGWAENTITETVRGDLENTTITHGA